MTVMVGFHVGWAHAFCAHADSKAITRGHYHAHPTQAEAYG
jgi:type 1 glutamine amidotransferase